VAGDRVRDGLQINRAFHGWSHRFLWNRELLAATLLACGFADLRWPEPGTSEREVFRGIDRHERYADTPAVPHVLLVEATRGEARPQELAALLARAEDEHLRFVRAASLAVDWLRSRMLARLPARGLAGWLLREHVIEATLVGGSVKLPVEAPEAARIEITIDLRHLVVDDPACRRRLGLLPVPGVFRRRFLDRLQGPHGLDVATHPHATFVATGAERVSPGRFAVAGEIQLRDRRAPLALELATSATQEDWRATAAFRLPLGELGFARRLAGTAPAREGETVAVELDLVAPVSAPT
jgi:polyisoprenoid-binding protein YceI